MKGILKILYCLPLLLLTACGQSEAMETAPSPTVETAVITTPSLTPQIEAAVEMEEETPPTLVESLVAEMTVEEKIGQLIMMDFRTNGDGSAMTTLSDETAQQITNYHLGGVILFGENLDTTQQTAALVQEMQAVSTLPLLIGVDEEGGAVSRLSTSQIPHESIPSAGKIDSDQAAADSATAIGEVLSTLGINVNFAPVADVNTNPNNPVIGSRAYSSDAELVVGRVSAFVSALQETGVSGAAKHFPGHGDTTTDSHTGNAVVSHDLSRLEEVEFLPFQAAIEADVAMILVGHIQLPNVTGDDLPATLNPQVIDLLRTNLGYNGIAITDAMNMGAITQNYGAGQSAVMAVEAGIDIVLMPADLEEAYIALLEAVESERITQENLDDSVTRILQLKYDLGLLSYLE